MTNKNILTVQVMISKRILSNDAVLQHLYSSCCINTTVSKSVLTKEDFYRMPTLHLRIPEEFDGERIDKVLPALSDQLTRSFVAKLCDDMRISVRYKEGYLNKKYKVSTGEMIVVDIPSPVVDVAVPEDIPLDIVYEDDDLIVINKPKGMVVHPGVGNDSGTLVNGLLYHCRGNLSAINGVIRPGIVHRIDKDTSGLIVAAKNNEAHLSLAAQLKERKALRKYYALVNDNIKADGGTVDKPIGRHPLDRKKMAVVAGGRDAVTHYRVLERFGLYTLVECTLETGRTHQIRVHMAYINHSIVGDKTYGIRNERFDLTGQLLHAKTLGFVHPRTGELMEFNSELSPDFLEVLEILRREKSDKYK